MQRSAGAPLAVLSASLLALCGLGALCPGLLAGLARLTGPLPLAWRLAARDSGRICTRDGAVVTAIFASLALAVAVGALGPSVDTYVGERTAGAAQGLRARRRKRTNASSRVGVPDLRLYRRWAS